jgi:hypothetical protein
MIILAYGAAAITAISIEAVVLSLILSLATHRHKAHFTHFSPAFVFTMLWIVAVLFVLVVELAAVTPILVAFRKRRWRWANAVTAGVAGAVIGAVTTAVCFTLYVQVQPLTKANIALGVLMMVLGLIAGAASGVAFRFIALKRDADVSQTFA